MTNNDGGLLPLTVPIKTADQALNLIDALLSPVDQVVLRSRFAPLVVKLQAGTIDPDTMLLIQSLALTATTFALSWANTQTGAPVDDDGSAVARGLVATTRAHHRATADLAKLDVQFPFDTRGDDGAG